MADEKQSLDEIIAKAAADTPGALEASGFVAEEKQEEKLATSEEKTEEKEEKEEKLTEEEKDELGLSKQDQLEAKQLLIALRDPNKAPAVIDFLARAQGYKRGDELTKKEETKVVKGMVEELKEALGPELEYLADKMGPVLEKRFKDLVEESQKPLRESIDQQVLEREQKAAGDSVEVLGKEYFDGAIPDNIIGEMSKTMDRMKPAQGQSMASYMEEILFVAAGKVGVPLQKTSKSKAEKLLKNRNDAASRLASEGGRAPKVGEKAVHPRTQMTLNDAIAQAMEASKAAVQ